MSKYRVHVYREMRLTYDDVEADSRMDAAEDCKNRATNEATTIEDCDGTNLGVLVDTVGDEQFGNSIMFSVDQSKGKLVHPAAGG